MRIDCHAHAFADKIADKAVALLVDYYKIDTTLGGHLGDLLTSAVEARLDALVMLVAATKPEQVKPANDWVLDVAGMGQEELRSKFGLPHAPQVVPFGAFHLGDPHWLDEIRRLRAAGIKGVKLHPEFQGIDLADPALRDFFAEIEKDFVAMVHVGDQRVSCSNFSTPRKVARILDEFPKLRLIAAHLGGYCFWDEACECLAGRDVYLDTSSSLPYIPRDTLKRLFAKHSTERIMMGSDYPLSTPLREMEALKRLDWLDDTALERIRGRNCAELLGLGAVSRWGCGR